MSARLLLVLPLVLALVAAVYFLGGSAGGPDDGLAPVSVHSPSSTGAPAASPLATPDPLAASGEAAPTRVAPAIVDAPEPAFRPPSDSRRVVGRVVFPLDTPDDETIEVHAHGKRFKGKEGRSGDFVTPVGADGRFEAVFAPDTSRGRIALKGRYVYLAKSVRIELDEHEGEVVLEPELGGRVAGTVALPPLLEGETADERAVHVSLNRWEGGTPVSRSALVEADGTYEMNGLPPGGGYDVETESRHFTAFETEGVAVEAGVTRRLDFTLTRGVRLTGRVTGPAGAGVARAEVTATTVSSRGSWGPQRSSFSTDDGTFELGGVQPGTVEVRVEHDDFLTHTEELGELREGEVRELALLLAAGDAVAGIVQWPDGSPAAKAFVRIDQEEQGSSWRWNEDDGATRTGSDGRFRFSGLEPRTCVVEARARPPRALVPSGPREHWNARVEAIEPGGRDVIIVLRAGHTLRGRAVDERGEPVARFFVELELRSEGPTRAFQSAFEDPAGAFAFDGLPEGEWGVRAEIMLDGERRPGFVRDRSETSAHTPQHGELVLRLERPAILRGIVVEPGGAPSVGAQVDARYPSRSYWMPAVHTAGEGRFELPRTAPGEVRLVAEREGFAPSLPLELDLAPGSELDGIVLELRPAARIRGVVSPLAGETAGRGIRVRPTRGGRMERATSDADGRFEVGGLTAGSYSVYLEEPVDEALLEPVVQTIEANHRLSVQVELAEGQTVDVVVGAGPSDPIRVHGRVTQAGEPASDVRIEASPKDRDAEHTASTDGSGRYEVTVDGPGDYRFELSRGEGSRVRLDVEVPRAGLERDFELPTASLAGTVRGTAGPLAGVSVSLQQVAEGRHADTMRTDGQGRYRFTNLPAGRFRVTAGQIARNAPEGELGHAPVETAELEVEAGAALEGIDLSLRPGGVLEGRVLNEASGIVGGSWVEVSTDGGARWTLGAYSDWRTGRYRCAGLPAGEIQARVRSGAGTHEIATARIMEGGTTVLDLTQ